MTKEIPVDRKAILQAQTEATAAIVALPKEEVFAEAIEIFADLTPLLKRLDQIIPALPAGILQQSIANTVVAGNNAYIQLKQATSTAEA